MNRTREVYKERHRGKVIGDFGLGIAGGIGQKLGTKD